jgi:FlgN protein
MMGLVEHLERQLASSRRLLVAVTAQREAIKAQDVETVLARLSDVQQEMVKRMQLERERDALLGTASAALGIPADKITLESVLRLVAEPDRARARDLSSELRTCLAEVARVHGQNRVMIRQELSFLDHLMRVLSGTPQGAYSPGGATASPAPRNIVDMRV